MNGEISLWCIVKGDLSLFNVKIVPEQTVADLKELIRDKHQNNLLKDVDAANLALWKVRRPHGLHSECLLVGSLPFK
jgi:hypothetical protein